jgi:hypothetical protein
LSVSEKFGHKRQAKKPGKHPEYIFLAVKIAASLFGRWEIPTLATVFGEYQDTALRPRLGKWQ